MYVLMKDRESNNNVRMGQRDRGLVKTKVRWNQFVLQEREFGTR